MEIDKELLDFIEWMIGTSIALTIAMLIPVGAFAFCCWVKNKFNL